MRDQLFMIILYEFMDLIVINIGFASVDKVYLKCSLPLIFSQISAHSFMRIEFHVGFMSNEFLSLQRSNAHTIMFGSKFS